MPRVESVWPLLLVAACSTPPASSASSGPARGGSDLPALIERLRGSVVSVDVLTRAEGQRARGIRQGTGSGFFIDRSCLLLTNLHVVDGALSVRVRDHRGEAWEGTIVGGDRLTDIALVRADAPRRGPCPAATLGDSSAARVGETVLAIGNPYGLSFSVTQGILSATTREGLTGPYDELLQTDAEINPGNSGGPLFNLRGEVIGINTASIKHASLSFAIPINLAKALLPQLQEKGQVRRGWLGVALDDVGRDLAAALELPTEGGALITDVERKSPAAEAGLTPGEVIISVDGREVGSGAGLRRALGMRSPGDSVSLRVVGQGSERTITVRLSENPEVGAGMHAPRALASDDAHRQRLVGLSLDDARGPKQERMVRIVGVMPGSAAERAGLTVGMKLTAVDEVPTRAVAEAIARLRAAAPDSVLVLKVIDLNGRRTLKALRIPSLPLQSGAVSKE